MKKPLAHKQVGLEQCKNVITWSNIFQSYKNIIKTSSLRRVSFDLEYVSIVLEYKILN